MKGKAVLPSVIAPIGRPCLKHTLTRAHRRPQRTARTNSRRQAEEGLEPGAFPRRLPAYSGHYHLPHQVPNTDITYIGSPYQVGGWEVGGRWEGGGREVGGRHRGGRVWIVSSIHRHTHRHTRALVSASASWFLWDRSKLLKPTSPSFDSRLPPTHIGTVLETFFLCYVFHGLLPPISPSQRTRTMITPSWSRMAEP